MAQKRRSRATAAAVRTGPRTKRDAGTGELRSSPDVRTGLIARGQLGIRAIRYAIIDGLAIFEGDIVLGTEEEMRVQTEQLTAHMSGKVAAGVAISGTQYRWPNCRVPYEIDSALPNQSRVTGAIQHWEQNTNYRFVLRTAANQGQYPDYVTFTTGAGCYSNVGHVGGQQYVHLGDGCSLGNAIHEIGHVVGLWHEQSREDRDSFVTIHWDKIQAGYEHNFDQHISDGDDIGPYDYGSIMHYPRDAFSVDGSDTITPIQAGATIGQRNGLSAGDIAAANSLCTKPVISDVKTPITDPTRKELVKDLPADKLKDLRKEAPLDTLKEQIKDLRLDTKKEQIQDTLKEQIKDQVKEAAFDPPYLKGAADRMGPGGQPIGPGALGGIPGFGPLPFVVRTQHQAPAAASRPGRDPASDASALDAHLQQLAEGLAALDTQRAHLQQQYDEVAALLRQLLDASDPGVSG